MKTTALIVAAILSISCVMALTDYRTESYNKYVNKGTSLTQYDQECPKTETHPGYYVQQIYVRTSKGLECQIPSGTKKTTTPKKITEIIPPIEEPKPVCEEVETCEEICENDWGWYFSHGRWKLGWHEDCDEECKTETKCEKLDEEEDD